MKSLQERKKMFQNKVDDIQEQNVRCANLDALVNGQAIHFKPKRKLFKTVCPACGIKLICEKYRNYKIYTCDCGYRYYDKWDLEFGWHSKYE